MSTVSEIMEKVGFPGGDLHGLPSSEKTFGDGANWRVEISGIESAKILQATIDEAKKQGVPFHRSISLVRGATWYTRAELEEFAMIASDAGVEVIITPGPRPTWYTGRQIATPEGALSGLRFRSSDQVQHYLRDIMRCVEIGFRGFLVWDEGVLYMLNEMKNNGDLPKDLTFKVSIFAGHGNAAGAKLLENLGAGTFNPIADISLASMAAIRQTVNIPMDIHIQYWDAGGGFNRIYETPDIARVASPCYFKMEPGPGLGMYSPWGMPEDALADLGRLKIRAIRNITEIISETYPEIKLSEQEPDDLRIPQPSRKKG